MPAESDSSSSNEELLAGFRLERRLGARTWLAMDPELGRRVALRLVQPPFDSGAWPEDPGVVDLLTAVVTPDGVYVATRFVPGARTWAERPGTQEALDQLAATLDRVTHGDLTTRDVLIDDDGSALLTGFGRPHARDDAETLATLRPRRARRSRAWLLVPVVVIGVTVALLLAPGGGDGIETVDCTGAEPGGSSEACTIVQTDIPPTTTSGTARAWTVRGVSGRVRLQVLVENEEGTLVANVSGPRRIDDPDTERRFVTAQEVPVGARFALQVDPGTGVGLRADPGAEIRTFTGPLHDTARAPDPEPLADRELQLRVDFIPDE